MKLTRTRLVIAVSIALLALTAAGCAAQGASKRSTATDGEPQGFAAPGDVPPDKVGSLSSAGTTSSDGAAAPGNPAPAADDTFAAQLNRKIVQNTKVDIKVKEVGRNFQDIINVAEVNGGFVASSSFSNVEGGQVADLTVRVPVDRYQDVLAKIRTMGDVVTEGSDSSDVTEEYTDLQARLRTLDATEQRYLELLSKADNVTDILALQDRLDSVRGEIEQVQGRSNLLDHLTDLATISVHLQPAAAVANGGGGGGGAKPLEAASNAWDASLDALRSILAGALVVAVFSWWLVPPLAGLGLGARWLAGRRPKPATVPAS